jgi:2-polyprenyl-6-methoxyphenol hydroxylase-like FAD-dependent oxidoreductase
MSENDVVVVGARCAGAATAMLLARRGHRVTVVERGRIPSDTLSTHGIARGGVVQLARWGLLDRVLDSGAPAIRQVVLRRGNDETVRAIRPGSGVDLLVAPRRHVLDTILADAAAEAGATIRTGVTATGVLRDDHGRVHGLRIRTANGAAEEIQARVVVGADGVRSRMAGLFGAEIRQSHPRDSATFYAYVSGLPWRGFEYHVGPSAFAGVFPTHDREACVWVCSPAAMAAGLHGGAADGFADLLGRVSPSLAARVRTGHVTSRVRGAVRLPNHLRQATGPGWALVGDAGYHRDPVTGHGMTDAFRDAELLATAIDGHLRGDAADLADYERRRDAAAAEVFAITCAMTRFPPPEQFVALQRQLSHALDVEADFLASLPTLVAA